MTLRLQADEDGTLAGIRLNEREFRDLQGLQDHIVGLLGDDGDPSAEVKFDCDYQLDYEHVIAAITVVSGRKGLDGNVVKLVEKIKFSPPRLAPPG